MCSMERALPSKKGAWGWGGTAGQENSPFYSRRRERMIREESGCGVGVKKEEKGKKGKELKYYRPILLGSGSSGGLDKIRSKNDSIDKIRDEKKRRYEAERTKDPRDVRLLPDGTGEARGE